MKVVVFLVLFFVMMGVLYVDDDDDGCEIIFGLNIGDMFFWGERVFIDFCVFCDCFDDVFLGMYVLCDWILCFFVFWNCIKFV